jgi:hypothetical protein
MKKHLLIIILAILFLVVSLAVEAANVARIKDLNITELKNSIEIDLKTTESISFNLIHYMNGDIGVRLLNAVLDGSLKENDSIPIAQGSGITDALIRQVTSQDLEIRLAGDISHKKINVHADVIQQNYILIEPEMDNMPLALMPLTVDAPEIPVINDFTLSPGLNTTRSETKIDKTSLNTPISMYSGSDRIKEYTRGKKLLAQEESLSEDILDFGSEPLSPTIPSEEDESITSNTSSSIVPEDQVRDTLNPRQTEDPEVTEAKDEGFITKTTGFLWQNKWWTGGIGCCGVIFVILLVLFFIGMGQSRAPEGVIQQGDPAESPNLSHDMQQTIDDNEPVNYIPPTKLDETQTISEAISKIIFFRNRDNK